jgi:hypothetical protein
MSSNATFNILSYKRWESHQAMTFPIYKVIKFNNIDKLSSFDISQVGHIISHNCGILAMSNMELGIEVCGGPCGSYCA